MPGKKRPDFRPGLVTPDSIATAAPRQQDPRSKALRDRFERQALALERGQQIEKLVGSTAAAWVASRGSTSTLCSLGKISRAAGPSC
jgi:hypothetical protein